MKFVLLPIALVAATLLGACGSSSTTTTATSTATPVPATTPTPTAVATSTPTAVAAPAITDARASRDRLLSLAPAGTKFDANGSIPGWQGAIPGVMFVGSGITADPSSVSGFAEVVSKAKGINYLAFAVKGSDGVCAGGVLESNSAGTAVVKSMAVDPPAGSDCTGNSVAAAGGYQ